MYAVLIYEYVLNLRIEVNILFQDKFDGIQLDVKEVQTVVLNLASEEEDVLTSTCQACFNFVMKGQ